MSNPTSTPASTHAPLPLAEALRKHATYYKDVLYAEPPVRTEYLDGTAGLVAQLIWDSEWDSEPFPEQAVLSVNLAPYGFTLPPGHVYVPDYSEHEGLPEALEAAGVGEKVEQVKIGFGVGWLFKLAEGIPASTRR